MMYLVILTCYGSSMVSFESPDKDIANYQAYLMVGDKDCYVNVRSTK